MLNIDPEIYHWWMCSCLRGRLSTSHLLPCKSWYYKRRPGWRLILPVQTTKSHFFIINSTSNSWIDSTPTQREVPKKNLHTLRRCSIAALLADVASRIKPVVGVARTVEDGRGCCSSQIIVTSAYCTPSCTCLQWWWALMFSPAGDVLRAGQFTQSPPLAYLFAGQADVQLSGVVEPGHIIKTFRL